MQRTIKEKAREETGYKGDSPSKKYARDLFWRKALDNVNLNGRILVLASHEGGDLSLLRGVGVDPKGSSL
jgi:hypothetical protein